MSDNLSFTALIGELAGIEAKVESLISRCEDLSRERDDLEKLTTELRIENEKLKQYALTLQTDLESAKQLAASKISSIFTTVEEKDRVKSKINDLIGKLNQHINQD